MLFTPKAHVSEALRHLRLSVTAAGGALAVALTVQMLVAAFVHFTDVRWTDLRPEAPATGELRIVRTNTDTAVSLTGRGSARHAAPEAAPPRPAPADVNHVLNRNDRWLNVASDLARSIGMIAGIVLMIATLLGVVVAGGASAPGVEKAVTAGAWSIVIALAVSPMAALLPGIAFPGALPSYDWITSASQALRGGAGGGPTAMLFYSATLLAPMVALIATAVVVARFGAGVEQGVIATSMSELDEKLRREMSSIKLGATSAPRAVGALHHAIGETPVQSPAPPSIHPPAPYPADGSSLRRIGEPTPGDSLKRPI